MNSKDAKSVEAVHTHTHTHTHGLLVKAKKLAIEVVRQLVKICIFLTNGFRTKIDVNQAKKEIGDIYQEKELFTEKDVVNLENDENIDLSIIIPVYNSQDYIEKCISSICEQKTNYKYEVIAVDDGSTDDTHTILSELSKKYINLKVITQENGGISKARNTGINNAKGNYIGFIDNDDYVTDEYADKLLKRAYEKKADIVQCNFVNYYENIDRFVPVTKQEMSISGKLGEKIFKTRGYVWSSIYKKTLWKNIRFPVGYFYEDMILMIIFMRMCNQYEYINENLYFYRLHSNSTSKTIWKKKNIKQLDQYFLLEKLLNLSNKLNLEKDSALYKIILHELGTCLWLRTRFLDKEIRKNIFAMASSLCKEYKKDCILTFEEKYIEKALLNMNFMQWQLVGIYSMLGVKAKK